eukprot:gb/GECH01013643.1/.p1 GENE.gb/GECH01013643.1/~~gb/GECH01013643.1/.p1  ORF type:complete len:277 (+),score=79.08 gb/GECH01013643.1/:1-831(+)
MANQLSKSDKDKKILNQLKNGQEMVNTISSRLESERNLYKNSSGKKNNESPLFEENPFYNLPKNTENSLERYSSSHSFKNHSEDDKMDELEKANIRVKYMTQEESQRSDLPFPQIRENENVILSLPDSMKRVSTPRSIKHTDSSSTSEFEYNQFVEGENEEINDQHKIFLQIASEFWNLSENDRWKEAEPLLECLIDHLKSHHHQEELLLRSHGCKTQSHLKEHEEFISKLVEKKNALNSCHATEVAEIGRSIIKDLSEWLDSHIKKTDRKAFDWK